MTGAKPELSIVIPAYNDPIPLNRLLASIKRYAPPSVEVWVVDDGSSPPLKSQVEAQGFNYVFQNNQGPCGARNFGATQARADALLFLDSDTEVLPDTIAKSLEIVRRPDFNVVTLVYHPQSLGKSSASEFKGLFDAFVWVFRPAGPATELCGQCSLFRKEAFFKTGGWSMIFHRPDMEHEEFSHRIKQHYTIMYYPGIMVKHQFPDFEKLVTSLFKRSISWASLRMRGRVQFDDLRRTPAYAVVTLMPLTMVAVLASGFIFPHLWLVLGPLFIFYLIGNWPFFKYLVSEGGPWKGAIYVGHHFIISLAVGSGACLGSLSGALRLMMQAFQGPGTHAPGLLNK